MTRTEYIALVRMEQEALRRFLLALCCGRRADAEDLAQETLVKAYLACGKMQHDRHTTAWLFKIAYRCFVDRCRSKRTTMPIEAAAAVQGASWADDDYRYQDLYQALDTLSEKERVPLLLHYLKGYAVAEIAEITGCSTDAVKKQLERGREQLKKRMKQ